MAHGAGAFLILISFGAILTSHVPAGWRLGRSRYMGLTLVVLVTFQISLSPILCRLGRGSNSSCKSSRCCGIFTTVSANNSHLDREKK